MDNNIITRFAEIYESLIFKHAGILRYPEKMKNDIINIVEESFQQYLNTGKKKYYESIPINLEGMPRQYSKLLNSYYKYGVTKNTIEIYLSFYDVDDKVYELGGSWSPHGFIISLYVGVQNLANGEKSYDKKDVINNIEHELSHSIQTFIELSMKTNIKAKPGYPSEWVPTKQNEETTKEYRNYGADYMVSGVEFFPLLRSNISEFLKYPRNKYDFLLFVYGSPFFIQLKLNKPKMYERAVKEAWKIVAEQLDNNPENENKSKNTFKMWKFISENKINIINQIDKLINKERPVEIDSLPSLLKETIKILLKNLQMQNYDKRSFNGEPIFRFCFEDIKKDNSILIQLVTASGKHTIFTLVRP